MKWAGIGVVAFIAPWYAAACIAAAYYGAQQLRISGWRRWIWCLSFWPF